MKDLVKNSVEETLNALLEHEADELVSAERYERSGSRKGYRLVIITETLQQHLAMLHCMF